MDDPGTAGAADTVRELARQGVLASRFTLESENVRRMLRAGGFELVWPLVYNRVTRRYEFQRGHHACAGSIHRMEPDCIDRFHDDVDAVLDDLFAHATRPIHNLEGWITRRLRSATVDGHRRRRGARGAMQKPRLPEWLVVALDRDRWLTELAVEMLTWVGVETSAGTEIWPIDAWVERWVRRTGDAGSAERTVHAQIETVLAAMRHRPTWYAKYIERPLGRKRPPVVSQAPAGGEPSHRPLSLTTRAERDDARLVELASIALSVIERRIVQGEDRRAVVTEVVNQVFTGGTGAEDLDRLPGDPGDPVDALLADRRVIDRVLATVLAVLRDARRSA
jgi:hypothetical protein